MWVFDHTFSSADDDSCAPGLLGEFPKSKPYTTVSRILEEKMKAEMEDALSDISEESEFAHAHKLHELYIKYRLQSLYTIEVDGDVLAIINAVGKNAHKTDKLFIDYRLLNTYVVRSQGEMVGVLASPLTIDTPYKHEFYIEGPIEGNAEMPGCQCPSTSCLDDWLSFHSPDCKWVRSLYNNNNK